MKRLEHSIIRDYWMGRGRYSKKNMSKTTAYTYTYKTGNPKVAGEGDDIRRRKKSA